MEALKIISESWPLAVMFIATCGAGVLFYLIRWRKQADLDDKAYRATQAVAVQQHRDNAG